VARHIYVPPQAHSKKLLLHPKTKLQTPSFEASFPIGRHTPLHEAQNLYLKLKRGCITSTYSHLNHVEGLDYQFNCYGFVNHCISLSYPRIYFELIKVMNTVLHEVVPPSFDGQPAPFNYASIFQSVSSPFWKRIGSFDDASTGDLLVFVPPNYTHPDSPPMKRKSTGTHIAIIHKSYGYHKGSYSFQVIDATRVPHGKEDSRYPRESGIGISPGMITPYRGGGSTVQWGKNASTIFHKEVTVGRLISKDSFLPLKL
jgi:hypothetical protein